MTNVILSKAVPFPQPVIVNNTATRREKVRFPSNMAIQVACRACCQEKGEGRTHSVWIEALQSASDMQNDIAATLDLYSALKNPCCKRNKWLILHYEGFEGFAIHAETPLTEVARIAAFINKYGQWGAGLLTYAGDVREAQRLIKKRYVGEFASKADFARTITAETSKEFTCSGFDIDYNKVADNLFYYDYFFIPSHQSLHVFRAERKISDNDFFKAFCLMLRTWAYIIFAFIPALYFFNQPLFSSIVYAFSMQMQVDPHSVYLEAAIAILGSYTIAFGKV